MRSYVDLMVNVLFEIVGMFNDYFSSIFTDDNNCIPIHSSNNPPPSSNTVLITPQLVFNKLTNLKSGRSPGPNGWLTEIITNTDV